MRWPYFLLLIFIVSSTGLGVPAPAFTLDSIADGKKVEVVLDPAKKATVVVFLSSVCPCSESHEPVLSALVRKFPDVKFYGVVANADEELADVKKHFGGVSLPFPVLYDKDQKLANKLGALKTPHAFVLTKDFDKPVYRGGVDNSHDAARATVHYLDNVLIALNSGKTPEISEARVLGCVISR